MVCGTTSDSGKSTVVTGLCRLLARRGVRVAPFKAQNMSLNSAVTDAGHEIGRAQAAQAQAAGIEPDVAMNPILLKPTSNRTSQVIVMGRPWAVLDAAGYQLAKAALWPVVLEQLAELRTRFDVVVCEGAGSPAEINLLSGDIVNLRLAHAAGLPAVVVGDIDRGGVFAALYGTVALLPDDLRPQVRAFVINKFRGDPNLLRGGPEQVERLTGVPTIGLLPWLEGIGIDAEDSLALRDWPGPPVGGSSTFPLDVVAVRFPRISNFTDLDALAIEPGVRLRFGRQSGRPRPAGPASYFREPRPPCPTWPGYEPRGLSAEVARLDTSTTTVLGICGGYQMLGTKVDDAGRIPDTGGRGGSRPPSGRDDLRRRQSHPADPRAGPRPYHYRLPDPPRPYRDG